ncbi:phage tail terminator family protein [Paenibacillus sp. DRB1-1]|uniref:phage tail terminator family protein n=1 Tax=Paenibacillus sp. DRB1-1 TaxID=3422309 RepID=UPI003F993D99
MEDVKNGILKHLSTFQTGVKVYDERIEQGFSEPCFFVLLIDGSQNREFNRRYMRTDSFDVHYFPSDTPEKRRECEAVADRLYEEMEYIHWEGTMYRAVGMKHQIVDDVLHFFLDINVHLMKPKEQETKMRTLKQEAGIRG